MVIKMKYSMPCRDINALKPIAKTACMLFLAKCKEKGLDIFITQTLRTAEYQNTLYHKGVSKCDGYKYLSNHQGGLAWDIACNGGKLYDENIIRKVGAIALELGISWGGTWKGFADTPHFEVATNWKPPISHSDEVLKNAVNKIIANDIKINAANWNDVSRMNMKYAQPLVEKLGLKFGKTNYPGTIDHLVSVGVITSRKTWDSKDFTPNAIRALLIKYSKL